VKNKVVLEMTLEEASAVLLALIDDQKGYTDGPAIPNRILNLRKVIVNLDESMENCVNNK
jgi:hypothetical protein